MKIVTYDELDPIQALNLSLLALDFPFTPEHAAHLRLTDPRPFPWLALYAVHEGTAVGQVGVFRLPMVTVDGREDVGGVWAVSTHPQYDKRGVASLLLEEAHASMREAGLRFSTLGTGRYRLAFRLYQRHGYQDMQVWGTAIARWELAHQPTRLRAELVYERGYGFVEELFHAIAKDYLGFSWRHTPFGRLRDLIPLADIWILWSDSRPVGYAFVHLERDMLKISDLVIQQDIDPAEAVAAVAARLKTAYVQVTVSRPSDITSLRLAGYQVAHPNWSAFMVKSLTPEVSVEDARRLFGFGTDRFLISWLDPT